MKKRLWIILLLPRRKIRAGLLACLALALLFFFLLSPYHYLAVFQTKALDQVTVLIDPGHGGIDGGVCRGELQEKEVTLEIAKLLKNLLLKKGGRILMTRETDIDLSHLLPNGPETRHRRDVHGRAKFINESNADLYVSIHVDACEDPSIRGAIVFYSKNSEESWALATTIQNSLNKVTSTNPQAGEYFHQNIKEGDLYLLNNVLLPGVIAEVGFITNNSDKQLLATHSYRKKLAEALCQGIVNYLCNLPTQ